METKYIIIAGAVLLIGLVTAGIIFAVRGRGPRETTTSEPVEITVWRLFEDEDVFKPIFDEYEQEHPNVKIKYEKKNFATYEEDVLNAIAGGKGPDIWSIPNDWITKHKDKLVPAPATAISSETYEDKFVDVVVEEGLLDGQIYGLPLYTDALGLYFNSELMVEALTRLKQSNPDAEFQTERLLLTRAPANWDDLISAVKLITQKSGNDVTMAGLAMGTADNTQNAAAILQALMLQNGTEMTNIDRTAASFHLPDKKQTGDPYYPGTEALDFYTAFALPNRAVYNWNGQLGSSLDSFMNKKAAMMINFQYVQQDLKQRAPTLFYDVAPLPQIKGSTAPVNVASYMMETVTKNSTHPDTAWDVVRWMGERANLFRSSTKRPSAERDDNEGFSDAFPVGIRTAKSVYKTDAKKYDEYFREMIRAVIDLRQPPQTAIDVAANKVTKLLLGQE